jgi:signal transduction histidine kinase
MQEVLPMVRRYLFAVVVTLAGFALTRLLWPFIEPVQSPLFLGAVVLSAWFGGLGPGLLAMGIALTSKLYFFIAPLRSLQSEDTVGLVQLGTFAFVAVLVSSLVAAQRRAEQERARLAEAEREARAVAEHANRAKDVFLAKVTHELRTPLQAMSSWTRVLRRPDASAEHRARALDAIEHSVQAQGRIIEDLLDVAGVVAGTVALHPAPTDLATAVHAAVGTVTAALTTSGVTVHVECDPAAGRVLADPVRLEQIVGNLVSNAVKFTPPGGRVDVRVERDGAQARIVVIDTGRGIPADVLPHIFDDFRRVNREDQPPGLGLGLAIVRRLVELHGGTVVAQSDGPGHGARFTVTLPALAAEPDDESGIRGARARST